MLVDFEVENFRSYRETRRLSMVASSAKELPQNLIATDLGMKLVRSAVIYGANASGKSNLLAAMDLLGTLLEFPTSHHASSWLSLVPYALDIISHNHPSRLRVRFLVEGVLYDYSVLLRPLVIEEERLLAYPHGRPQEWFRRKKEHIEFSQTHLKGQKQSLKKMMRTEAPFLAVATALDHAQLAPVGTWLLHNLSHKFKNVDFFIRVLDPPGGPVERAANLCKEDYEFRKWATQLLRHADLGIQDLLVDKTTEWSCSVDKSKEGWSFTMIGPALPEGSGSREGKVDRRERYQPFFLHSSPHGYGTRLGLFEESHGTRRLFIMLVPLYGVFREGQLAVIDELGGNLHPSLVREIIRAFHDRQLNPRDAQLIFATHDTSLLSGQLFRRDQVWFTEKDANGATDLSSLNDVKGVREDESFEKGYLRGRYGAIPFFGSFDFPPVTQAPAETST